MNNQTNNFQTKKKYNLEDLLTSRNVSQNSSDSNNNSQNNGAGGQIPGKIHNLFSFTDSSTDNSKQHQNTNDTNHHKTGIQGNYPIDISHYFTSLEKYTAKYNISKDIKTQDNDKNILVNPESTAIAPWPTTAANIKPLARSLKKSDKVSNWEDSNRSSIKNNNSNKTNFLSNSDTKKKNENEKILS